MIVDGEREGDFCRGDPLVRAEEATFDPIRKEREPVQVRDDLFQLLSGVARREKTPHQSAHAGARHYIDGHAELFEKLDDPDVRQPFGTPPAEYQTDAWPGCVPTDVRGAALALGRVRRPKQQGEA